MEAPHNRRLPITEFLLFGPLIKERGGEICQSIMESR